MFVNRNRDKRLILSGLYHADSRGYDINSMLGRRFPAWSYYDVSTLPSEFTFRRDETPIVVGALVLAAQEMQRARELRQTEGLVGQLVVAAAGEYYHQLSPLARLASTES